MLSILRSSHALLLMRCVFFAALLFAVVMALLPKPPHIVLDNFGDKFEHSLAFVTLTGLAALSFPASTGVRIGERLSFLGALIEVFQSIPSLHRDCDVFDWIFDTAAIGITLGLVWAITKAWPRLRQGPVPLLPALR